MKLAVLYRLFFGNLAPQTFLGVRHAFLPHEKTTQLTHMQAFVLAATRTIPLKKKSTSEVKFAERKSALLQNNNV